MNWYLQALRKYADFNGRARRTEYWMYTLFNIIFTLVAILLDNLVGTAIDGVGYGLFYFVYALAVLVPSLAVGVRRLHDTDKSGWMMFVGLIPLVGGIWLLVLMATDSTPGANEYGPNPKGVGSDEPNDAQLSSLAKDPSIIDAQESSITTTSSTRDTIIIVVVAWMLVSRLLWTVLPLVMEEIFSTDAFKVINTFTNIVWAFIPLALAFAVKDKTKQIVLFVLSGILLIMSIYDIVQRWNMDY